MEKLFMLYKVNIHHTVAMLKESRASINEVRTAGENCIPALRMNCFKSRVFKPCLTDNRTTKCHRLV